MLTGLGVLILLGNLVVGTGVGQHGVVALAEGQAFSGARGDFLGFAPKEPRFWFPRLAFEPLAIDVVEGEPGGLEARVRLEDGEEASVSTWQPLERGRALLVLAEVGLSPKMTLWDLRTQTALYDSFVNLDFSRSEDGSDTFEIPDPAMSVRVRAEALDEGEKGGLRVWVRPADAPEGYEAEGLLTVGKGLEFGPYLLGFSEYRDWGLFHVYKQRTRAIPIAGWTLFACGLMLGAVLRLSGRPAGDGGDVGEGDDPDDGVPEAPDAADLAEGAAVPVGARE
jgi:hypothetical protein